MSSVNNVAMISYTLIIQELTRFSKLFVAYKKDGKDRKDFKQALIFL